MIEMLGKLAGYTNGVVAIVGVLGTCFLGWLATRFVSRREFSSFEARLAEATAKRDRQVNDRLSDTEGRAADLQRQIDQLPKRSALNRLELDLKETQGDIKKLSTKIDGVTEVMARIERPLNLLVEHHIGFKK
ncbi:MAG: DUF2730 family protein [Sphingomonadales bacterium]